MLDSTSCSAEDSGFLGTADLTRRQKELVRAFSEMSPVIAETYGGLLHALQTRSLPNRKRLIAYQARTLMDLVPRSLGLPETARMRKPLSLGALRNELQAEFERLSHKHGTTEQAPLASQAGCAELFEYVDSWLKRSEESRHAKRKLVRSSAVRLDPAHATPFGQRQTLIIAKWSRLEDYFNALLHGSESTNVTELDARIAEFEDFFLDRLCPRAFDNQKVLEELMEKDPQNLAQEETASLLRLLAALDVNYRFFFANLSNPAWIDFLEERGFFNAPPDVEEADEHTLAPYWPELLYLERMIQERPLDVARISLQISRSCPSNPRVHETLLEISCGLLEKAQERGRRLLNSELNWISSQSRLHYGLPDLILKAAVAAAAVGSSRTALRSVGALLALETAAEASAEDSNEAWLRMDRWEVKGVLESLRQTLLQALDPALHLILLKTLCDFVVVVGRRKFGDGDTELQDASFQMWRPAIEDHPQNDPDDLVSWAIEAVRDLAEALLPSRGITVLQLLEHHDLKTMSRISLFLRSRHPAVDPCGSASLLGDPEVLEDTTLRHELFLLLNHSYGTLDENAQSTYCDWVVSIPDLHRRHLYLWPIREHLTGSIREEYESYLATHGELEHPDLPTYHETVWVGPVSPFDIAEMSGTDLATLVAKLNAWAYEPGWRAPEPEGLARELAAFSTGAASEISSCAEALMDLNRPTYVRGFVQGLASAVKEGTPIEWEPVLEFCLWGVQQERGEGPEGNGLEGHDLTWAGARKQIAWLLTNGLRKSPVEIPFHLKKRVWAILAPLVTDPDPTTEEEAGRAKYSDPSTIAINTVRGVALGAVFSFALWVARHNPQGKRTWLQFGMTEARAAVELRLREDESPAIRSLFGKWLQHLYWLDEDWTRSNIGWIFPLEDHLSSLWTAVWTAYLMFSSTLAVEFLPMLKASYQRSLKLLGTKRPQKTRLGSSDERLGQHLILFYRESVLPLDDPVFRNFFTKADGELRYRTMFSAIRGLQTLEKEKQSLVVARLQELWQWRADEAIDEIHSDHHELSSFSWWFLKTSFAPEWRLAQLLRTQRKGIKLALDGRVLEELSGLSAHHLSSVLDCLDAIVRNPRNEHWAIYDNHAKDILSRCLGAGHAELQDQAEELIHYIGSLGYLSFGRLLDSSTGEAAHEGEE